MTKLIDSLCGVKALGKCHRIQDSYNDVSPDKIANAKRFVAEEADRPEDALYEVMDYLYDSPVAIDTDRDVVDVEAKGYYWPNGDAFRSSVVKVNEPGVAMTSLWGSGNPRDLWFIPLPVAEICEIDDPKVTPGYYYLDGETNTIARIGETNEDLDKWVASLDTDETIEAQKRDFAKREQFERDKRRMFAEVSRENVEDSSEEDSKRQSAMEELNKLRKSIPDSKIIEALSRVSSSEDLFDLIDRLHKFYDIKPTVSDSSDDEYRQFDRFNALREEVSDKEIVDVLPSYMGGFEINKFVDRVRAFYGLDQNPDEEIEDSASAKGASFLGYLSVKSKSDTGTYSAKTPKGAVYLVESPVESDNANSILVFSGNPSVAQVKRAISKKEGEDAGKALDESDVKEAVKSKVKVNPETDYEITLAPLSVSTKSKVSDATYNPKFEKLRKVLSDTSIVEELSHYMSSDELEEFTETLTRNYDIDLEEVEDSAK